MDKNAIKSYAVWAREELIEKVTARAVKYDIVKDKELNPSLDSINGEVLSESEKAERKALIKKINEDGYDQVIEEVAYTWFNRFIAIRFMEVNGYLPSHIRVFSNENGEFKPQILAEAIHLDLPGLDMEKVLAYKDASNEEELFKYLLKVQCNALNEILPQMFQKLEDYTELLLPDYLLREGSVIETLVNDISEDNFDISSDNGQIEIIGWMYQYYISAKHEEVVDPLHGKVVKKEEVPAATQLFTTDWVVRYLIDNSVGKYWIERNPESQLAKELTYFVTPKDGQIKYVNEKIAPQDVTIFDPCVGSGHFLVYAFEVLMKIYVEYGFSERDAASEIVKNNIFGLDIDGRATQLAYFAVMMKARQYDRRFFTRGIQPQIYEITESNNVDRTSIDYFCGNDVMLKNDVEILLDTLMDAKEYGSTLQIPEVGFEKINDRFIQIADEISMYNTYLLGEFKSIIMPAYLMSKKYTIVATNPPYLNKYDTKLKKYIIEHFNNYKGDLFSVFMYRNFDYCTRAGYTAFMTPNVWMFIVSYEKLRTYILKNKQITTLIQMAKGAFFKEATVDVCAFVMCNENKDDYAQFFRLEDVKGDMDAQRDGFFKALRNQEPKMFFEVKNHFDVIPSTPIAYWLSSRMLAVFEETKKLADVAKPRQGLATSDNDRFLRFWHEVDFNKIGFGLKSIEDERKYSYKWFPCTKGGSFRRWYGNNYYVVNWENDGKEIKEYAAKLYKNYTRTIKNIPFYFKKGLTWSTISSGLFSLRFVPEGFIFETKGAMCYVDDNHLMEVLALYNTNLMQEFLQVISPTLDYHEGSLGRTPIKMVEDTEIVRLSKECVSLVKKDWDLDETSWDFDRHFLVTNISALEGSNSYKLSDIYEKVSESFERDFNQVKNNEEILNRKFAEYYGLSEEIDVNVDDKNISMRLSNARDDVIGLISYAVGCMFGRYSLDEGGIIYAGGQWDEKRYKTFLPDKDAIIPICDDEYFSDDIVGRFCLFMEVVYGKEYLEENLQFVADAIGGKGSAREVIRNYFINDFYTNHLKMYQKRPIYWLFDSGKKNGFKCLVYMHRYQPDTIARIRTDYVHEQQARYRTAIEETANRIENASGSDKVKLTKKLNTLKAQVDEIHTYEEIIHHLADQMISIDLDDGVKKNYEIFKDVLAKLK